MTAKYTFRDREVYHPLGRFAILVLSLLLASIALLMTPVLRLFGRRGFVVSWDPLNIVFDRNGFRRR